MCLLIAVESLLAKITVLFKEGGCTARRKLEAATALSRCGSSASAVRRDAELADQRREDEVGRVGVVGEALGSRK